MKTQEIEISIGLIKINSSYICLKRNLSPYKNFIEFPGGKRRPDECVTSCLIREIKEELNISVKKYKYIGFIKHLYGDVLIKINIFKIFQYKGKILSNENRDIIIYNNDSIYKILPTHQRILNTLKTPRILKIINTDNMLAESLPDLSIYKYIRLRNISYKEYEKIVKEKLRSMNFTGKTIIDYPFANGWLDDFHGIHYNSTNIKYYEHERRNSNYIYSASCHNANDINVCNKKYFDFILLSPLHESYSEYNILGWKKFSELCIKSNNPTLALGGISLSGLDYSDCINNNGFGISGVRNV